MRKRNITIMFGASVAGLLAGLLLVGLGILMGVGTDSFTRQGPDVVGVHNDPAGWFSVGVVVLGLLTLIGAAALELAAWIAALVGTVHLESKTWFVVLLVSGLVNLGVLGALTLLAYVLYGPEVPAAEPAPAVPAPLTRQDVRRAA